MKPTVLVVDDEIDVTSMLQDALGEDCNVVTANDGHYGLAEVVVGEEPIDLVITDLKMNGMNGVELMRNLPDEIPVIVISGYLDMPEFQVALKGLAPSAVFRKPFSIGDLRAAVSSATAQGDSATSSGPPRILVIDDEEMVRNALCTMLEIAGYEIETACDGEDGIEKWRHSPADVVIVDYNLPDRTGLEVIQRLREVHPELKSIAISGVSREHGPLNGALGLGASLILEKPFRMQKLLDAVQSLFDGESSAGMDEPAQAERSGGS
jgi:CheY-like chemotaxis protein